MKATVRGPGSPKDRDLITGQQDASLSPHPPQYQHLTSRKAYSHWFLDPRQQAQLSSKNSQGIPKRQQSQFEETEQQASEPDVVPCQVHRHYLKGSPGSSLGVKATRSCSLFQGAVLCFLCLGRKRYCIVMKNMIYANRKAPPQYYMTQRKKVCMERRQRLL